MKRFPEGKISARVVSRRRWFTEGMISLSTSTSLHSGTSALGITITCHWRTSKHSSALNASVGKQHKNMDDLKLSPTFVSNTETNLNPAQDSKNHKTLTKLNENKNTK